MDFAKEEIFPIKYNCEVSSIQRKEKKWINRIIRIINENKFISMVVVAFVIFSMANIIMITNFMVILQKI